MAFQTSLLISLWAFLGGGGWSSERVFLTNLFQLTSLPPGPALPRLPGLFFPHPHSLELGEGGGLFANCGQWRAGAHGGGQRVCGASAGGLGGGLRLRWGPRLHRLQSHGVLPEASSQAQTPPSSHHFFKGIPGRLFLCAFLR